MKSFYAHSSYINRIKQLKNGFVATASDDKTVKIWDVSNFNWTLIRKYASHTHYVKGLEYINSDTVASG